MFLLNNCEYKQLQEIRKRGTALFPIGFYVDNYAVPGAILHSHWHTEWQWIYIIHGNGIFTIDDTRYHANSGDSIFVNSGQFHSGISESSDGCTFMSIVFEPDSFYGGVDIVREYYNDFRNGRFKPYNYFSSKNNNGRLISMELSKIYQNFQTKEHGYEITIKACLLTILSVILKNKLFTEQTISNTESSPKISTVVTNAIEFIYDNYQNKIALQDIADHVSLSKQSLCRLFKSSTGTTVVDYLNTYRIFKACLLLKNNGSQPINVIAEQCGFENTSYFIKLFKRYKETTPTKYLEKISKILNSEEMSK